MKKLLTTLLLGAMLLSFAGCSNDKKGDTTQTETSTTSDSGMGEATGVTSDLVPKNATIIMEEEGSLFLEVNMTYEETVKFYEDVVKKFDAEGTVSDMGSSESLWAYTGTYGPENSILSITVSPLDGDSENACSVSIHY